jgi:hypothetical protein
VRLHRHGFFPAAHKHVDVGIFAGSVRIAVKLLGIPWFDAVKKDHNAKDNKILAHFRFLLIVPKYHFIWITRPPTISIRPEAGKMTLKLKYELGVFFTSFSNIFPAIAHV